MHVQKSEQVPITSSDDIGLVRRVVREWAIEAGFNLVEQTKMITAASELARNIVTHGGGRGMVTLELVQSEIRRGLRLVFADQGPGIEDIGLAMRDGYTTGQGLGMGLGGAKRLVNDFDIESRPGQGTTVTITRWK